MKIFYSIVVFFIVLLIGFFNLGNFLDASQKPIKSDIIVSLGGGDGCRIKKALNLYQSGYSSSKKFLYTGREIVNPALETRFSKSEFLRQGGVLKEDITFVKRGVIVNTVEELFFIKAYMKHHGYKSVLIVSEPVHTRRIKTVAKYIASFDDLEMKYTVTSCKKTFWNPKTYYQDPQMRKTVFMEFIKLIYNLVKYSSPLIGHTSYEEKKESLLWKKALESL